MNRVDTKDNPLVSIIITCYNQESIIKKSILSIIDQTYANWECIIVDDGSTDNSNVIIKELAKSDSRIFYIRQDNQGVSIARNNGFKQAQGEFIQFLDGDDWLLPMKLELQIRHFQNNPNLDISYTNHQHFLHKSGKFMTFKSNQLESDPLYQFLYEWHNGLSIPIHAGLYRRKLWQMNETPFPEDYFGREEDWIFNILIAIKKPRYQYLDKILCVYYIGENNFTNSLLNSCIYKIEAAFYINNLLPDSYKNGFLRRNISNSLIRYQKGTKIEVLHSSKNWQIGNFLTKPFYRIIQFFTKK